MRLHRFMKPPVDPDPQIKGDGKQKPIVVISIEDDTGLLCVDVLEFKGHGFGFCEFRRDPEDPHGWRPTGLAHECTLNSRDLALVRARTAIGWLNQG